MKKVVVALAISGLSVSGDCSGMNSVWNSVESAANHTMQKVEFIKNKVKQKPVVQKVKSAMSTPIGKGMIMGALVAVCSSSLAYYLDKNIEVRDVFLPFVLITSLYLEMSASKGNNPKQKDEDLVSQQEKAESSALRPGASLNTRGSEFVRA